MGSLWCVHGRPHPGRMNGLLRRSGTGLCEGLNRVSPGFSPPAIRKPVGKTKEELALEKKRELEKRLQDVSGQLNSTKKPPKKGECFRLPPLIYVEEPGLAPMTARQVFVDRVPHFQPLIAASEKTEPSSAQQVAVSRLSASSSSSDSSSSSSSSSSSDTSDSDSG